MSRPVASSPALPLAYAVLRFLLVLNWLGGAMILALLLIPGITREWIMQSLNLVPGAEAERVILGLRAIAAIGLASIPLNHIILKRLLAIVETVREGDPFVPGNATRLQAVAWTMLGLQALGFIVGAIVKSISSPDHPLDIKGRFSLTGLLAVLLVFLLSRVFAEGTMMRDDLEGMV